VQISCPRCATSYELDERVLPAGGAPVQCTRCSHVFTAHPPPRPGHGTQIFGSPNVAPGDGSPAAPDSDSAQPGDEFEPPPPEERTQIYGRTTAARAGSPSAPSPSTQIFGSAAPPDVASSQRTQIFGAGSLEATSPQLEGRAAERTQVFGRVTEPVGDAADFFDSLPAAPTGDPPWASAHRRAEFAADPRAMARATRFRRRNVVLGVLAAMIVAAVAGAGLRVWHERSKAIPPEALAAQSEAVTWLRRDDPASIADARTRLQAVVHKWPGFLEAQALHLMAMLFQLDEARMELQHLTDESTSLNARINLLREERSPGNWQDRVNALVDRLGEIKAQIDPTAERASALDAEVDDAFRALQDAAGSDLSPEDEIQLVRAQALYFGIKGSEKALTLSERYRVKGGQEGWGDLAWAEYALNARAPPETLGQARAALEALRAKDPSWVRLYVLIGRLAAAERALDAATTAFESALTLNPKHQTARSLLRRVEKQKKHATAE
jgi:predicted Zn finger-like uncharacterized protein